MPEYRTQAQILRQEFPEGVPNWMLTRDYTTAKIRELMKLRREAFPKTVKAS